MRRKKRALNVSKRDSGESEREGERETERQVNKDSEKRQ
jgi:hypothetical protein